MNIAILVEQTYNMMRIRNVRTKLKQGAAKYTDILIRFKPIFIQNKWNMEPLNKLASLIDAFNYNIQQLGVYGYDTNYINGIASNSNDIEDRIIGLILYCDNVIRIKLKE